MKDYTHLYRKELHLTDLWSESWDIFISAYNTGARVPSVFEKATAARKFWIVHSEYEIPNDKLPNDAFVSDVRNEAEFVLDFFETKLSGEDLAAQSVCIDITGFLRPHLMFLVKYLVDRGVKRFDAIYSEPDQYKERERTEFSDRAVVEVRQVVGYEGVNEIDTSADALIIGAGYESHLISEVAENKEKAERIVVFGWPSLRADMYQQSRLRVHEAADSIGETTTSKYFAPANDPFVVATVLSEIVAARKLSKPITNLYLAPLSTKAQALGFALFYISECTQKSVSVIYPFSTRYADDTSRGISRIWLNTVEVD